MKQRQKPKRQPQVVVVQNSMLALIDSAVRNMKRETHAWGSKKFEGARVIHDSGTYVSTDKRAIDRRERRRATARRRFLAGKSPQHPGEKRRRYRIRKRRRNRRLARDQRRAA